MPVNAPVADPETTTPVPVLPPRRTWRDLPASPPVGDFLPPPDPDHLIAPAGGGEEPPADEPPADAAPQGRRSRKRTWVALGLVAALLVAVGGVVWRQNSSSHAAATTPTVAPPKDPGSQTSVEQVAKALGPAVVQIEVGQGLGSGVIYDSSGLILTAHHVVEGTDEVTVRTADKQTLPGRVVGRAPERDLAIVAVTPSEPLTAAPLAEPGSVEVGETAIALGSPFGFQATVTSGIVSGLNRELDTPAGKLTGLIQTDAPINPGNSGGPLADANAKVIGINTAIASASGGSDGVGFAIPVEDAKVLMDQVKAGGGAKAPTTPDAGGSGQQDPLGGLGLPPGLNLPPDIQNLLPDLQNLLPDLNGLLPDLGSGSFDDVLRDLLNQLSPGLGDQLVPGGTDNGGSGTQPGGSGGSDQGNGQSEPASLALVQVPNLPSGYEQLRSSSHTSKKNGVVEGTQLIVLKGGDGEVTIAAERSDQTKDHFDALQGDATKVGGHDAKQIQDGLAWMADSDLLVIIHADAKVSKDDVKAVAEAVEVVK
jgi:putative serine protease PepD